MKTKQLIEQCSLLGFNILVLLIFVTLISRVAQAQNVGFETTCRAQAKEVALQTYSACLTQSRNQKIEEIRESYKKELNDLKRKYEDQLNGLSATPLKSKKNSLNDNSINKKNKKSLQYSQKLPLKLPTKKETTDPLPIQQNLSQDPTTMTVVVTPTNSASSIEEEAATADSEAIEVINPNQ